MKINSKEIVKTEFKSIVSRSNSIREIINHYGMVGGGNNYRRIYQLINEFNLNISHFKRSKKGPGSEISSDKAFVANSSLSTTCIKRKLFKFKIRDNKCEFCGQGDIWKGKKISLHLDHINGIRNDHRLENIRILCPNCHAATPNYCGRNMKKKAIIKIKKNYNEICNYRKTIVENSKIDFSSAGWGVKLSKEFKVTPVWSMQWVKKNMPDFYLTKCFHHQI